MKTIRIQTLFAFVLAAGFVLTLSPAVSAVDSAAKVRKGRIHMIKDTSSYDGLPGGFVTIVASDLPEIPVGSKIFYDQAPDIPTGLLDSSTVLDTGNGNRAVGRCTTDMVTWIGLCTFSDGLGTLAGFEARLNVSPADPDFITFHLDGVYRFRRLPQ